MVERYNSWEEYYRSNQDAYLDSENSADCDIRVVFDGYLINGKLEINHYSVESDDGSYVEIFANCDLDYVLKSIS